MTFMMTATAISSHTNKSTIGILRYKVDFQSLQADELLDDVDLDDY